jgi:hypothetical protein
MVWYNEFNAGFWLTVTGVVSASLGLCIRSILRSKCSRVNLCCITCIRDTQAEKEEDLVEMHKPSTETIKLSSENISQ